LTEATALDEAAAARRDAIGVLAHAGAREIAAIWNAWQEKPAFDVLRGPETGLVMVRGRTGGAGAPFNLGEATVTRATVRLASGEVGHAYALGRDRDKAIQSAVFDALFQRDRAAIEDQVIAPLRKTKADADRTRAAETAATRVDFFTMVRGDD
jgi:alpha-D-ribose 1-methylphosphonate 5-triphosphate synthase subunit PhnG